MKNNTAIIDKKDKEITIKYQDHTFFFHFSEFNNDSVYFGIEFNAYILKWNKGDDQYLSVYKVNKGIIDNVGLTLEIIKK